LTDPWIAPPHRPLLRPGDVHLWLSRPVAPDPRDIELLDPHEQGRMARFRHPKDRVAFAHARAFLRHTLAGYLSLDPAGIRFVHGHWGRPELAPNHVASGPLSFNLAHSEGVVLLAASRHPVGVDLEVIRELPDVDRLIEETLTSDEADLVLREDDSQRSRAFLRFWTRKEAFLKGIGVGLSVAPQFADLKDPELPLLRTSVPGLSPATATGWRAVAIEPTPETIGALVVQGVDARLHRYEAPRAEDVARNH